MTCDLLESINGPFKKVHILMDIGGDHNSICTGNDGIIQEFTSPSKTDETAIEVKHIEGPDQNTDIDIFHCHTVNRVLFRNHQETVCCFWDGPSDMIYYHLRML